MLGEGTIGGGCRMEVVAMAVAIEEGTCKRVRQVKTAVGEDAGGWGMQGGEGAVIQDWRGKVLGHKR